MELSKLTWKRVCDEGEYNHNDEWAAHGQLWDCPVARPVLAVT